jgi:hypothetical protein
VPHLDGRDPIDRGERISHLLQRLRRGRLRLDQVDVGRVALQQLVNRRFRHQAPVIEDRDAVAHALHVVEDVSREQHGRAAA